MQSEVVPSLAPVSVGILDKMPLYTVYVDGHHVEQFCL